MPVFRSYLSYPFFSRGPFFYLCSPCPHHRCGVHPSVLDATFQQHVQPEQRYKRSPPPSSPHLSPKPEETVNSKRMREQNLPLSLLGEEGKGRRSKRNRKLQRKPGSKGSKLEISPPFRISTEMYIRPVGTAHRPRTFFHSFRK